MASNVYKTMSSCHSCAKAGTTFNHKRHRQLFPAMGQLEFVTGAILGPLLKTTEGNQNVVMITDRHSKMTRAVRTATISTNAVVYILFDA